MIDKEIIYDLYVNKKYRPYKICMKLNISKGQFDDLLFKYGIKNSTLYKGTKFHNLTIISEPIIRKYSTYKTLFVMCQCDCGNIKEIRLNSLKNGNTKSCGCLLRYTAKINSKKCIKHNLSKHKLYSVWRDIKTRCYNSNYRSYRNYGGRGITMCDEWKNSFENFYNWSMENNWNEDLEIDRIDVNGNYYPENCRFVTSQQNMNNVRYNVYITAFNETKTIANWARDNRCNISYKTLHLRIKNGWPPEKAISIKKYGKCNK